MCPGVKISQKRLQLQLKQPQRIIIIIIVYVAKIRWLLYTLVVVMFMCIRENSGRRETTKSQQQK